MANKLIEIKVIRNVETPFMGSQECDYRFATDDSSIKMTKEQIELIREIRDHLFNNPEYTILHWNVAVYKHFVSVAYWYFPTDAKNTVYCTRRKHVMIGKKGAIRSLRLSNGLSKDHDMIPKYRIIARDYAIDPEES